MKKLLYFGCFTATAAMLSSTSNSRIYPDYKDDSSKEGNQKTRTIWFTSRDLISGNGSEELVETSMGQPSLLGPLKKKQKRRKLALWHPKGSLDQEELYNTVDPITLLPLLPHQTSVGNIKLPSLDILKNNVINPAYGLVDVKSLEIELQAPSSPAAEESEEATGLESIIDTFSAPQNIPSPLTEEIAEINEPGTPLTEINQDATDETPIDKGQTAAPVEEFFAEEVDARAEPEELIIVDMLPSPSTVSLNNASLPQPQVVKGVKIINAEYKYFHEIQRFYLIKTIQRRAKPAVQMSPLEKLKAQEIYLSRKPTACEEADEIIDQLNQPIEEHPRLAPTAFSVAEKEEEILQFLRTEETVRSHRYEDLQEIEDKLALDILNMIATETRFNLAYKEIAELLEAIVTPVKSPPPVEETINSGALRAKKRILNKTVIPVRSPVKNPATPEPLKQARRMAALKENSPQMTTDEEWDDESNLYPYTDTRKPQMRESVMRNEFDFASQARKAKEDYTTPVRPKPKNYGSKNALQILSGIRKANGWDGSPEKSEDVETPPSQKVTFPIFPSLKLQTIEDKENAGQTDSLRKKEAKPEKKNFFQRLFSKPKAKQSSDEQPEEIELSTISFNARLSDKSNSILEEKY